MANPCTLRQQFGAMPTRPLALKAPAAPTPSAVSTHAYPLGTPLPAHANFQMHSVVGRSARSTQRRSDSPPRMEFKTLQQRGACDPRSTHAIELSLASLNMDRRH